MIHQFTLMGYRIVLDIGSGAVHLLDETAYDMLSCLQPPLGQHCPEDVLEKLYEKYDREDLLTAYAELYDLQQEGALFSDDGYEAVADRMVEAPVKAMCLNVSHDCNLRCAYCFAGKGDYDQGRMVMTAETGKRAVDFLIANSGERRYLELDFFGGEPLMNFDVVREVVSYARLLEQVHNREFRFTITTNGVLLDDEKIDFINREMSNVVLSLDGRKEVNDRVRRHVDGSGSHDRVAENFRTLVQSRGEKEYYVRGTFTSWNLDFADDVVSLYEQGFDQISVEPVVCDPKQEYAIREEHLPKVYAEYERLAELLSVRRKQASAQGRVFNFFHFMVDLEQGPCVIKRLRGCGCGNEYVAVTPDGDIYPCHQFIGDEQWKMGNLYDGSFDQQIRQYFSKTTVYQKPDCAECWARFYCSGGCNANNLHYAGDVLNAHSLSCEMEKKRLECAIALQARRMEEAIV